MIRNLNGLPREGLPEDCSRQVKGDQKKHTFSLKMFDFSGFTILETFGDNVNTLLNIEQSMNH